MRAKPSVTRPLCAVGATWRIWLNDQATCILKRLSNSSREDGRKDCPEQIQQQHKKTAKVAISNSFCTVHVPIADTEWMKSLCIMATGVGLWFYTATRGYHNRSNRVAATGLIAATRVVTAAVTGSVGLPGRRRNSRPKVSKPAQN